MDLLRPLLRAASALTAAWRGRAAEPTGPKLPMATRIPDEPPWPRIGLIPSGGAPPDAADPAELVRAIRALDPGDPEVAARLDPLIAALESAIGAPFELHVRSDPHLPIPRSLRWSEPAGLLVIRGDLAFAALDPDSFRPLVRGGAVGSLTIGDTFDARIGPRHAWSYRWHVSPGASGAIPPGAIGVRIPPPDLPDGWLRAFAAARGADPEAIRADLAREWQPGWRPAKGGSSHRQAPPLPDRGPVAGETALQVALPFGPAARARVERRLVLEDARGHELPALPERVEVSRVALSSDGRLAAHVTRDGEVRLWRGDPLGGQRLAVDGYALAVAFGSDRLVVGCADSVACFRRDGAAVFAAPIAGEVGEVAVGRGQVAAVTPDGTYVLDAEGRVRAELAEPVVGIAAVGPDFVALTTSEVRLVGSGRTWDLPGPPHRVAASADGRRVAFATWNEVIVTEPDGRIARRIPVDRTIDAVAVANDGAVLVLATGRAGEADTLLRFPPDEGPPTGALVPPQGARAIAADAGLWAVARGHGVELGDAVTGRTLVVRHDVRGGAAGVQQHGHAIEGWGEFVGALLAFVGPVDLPTPVIAAAAASPGLVRRRLELVRGHRGP